MLLRTLPRIPQNSAVGEESLCNHESSWDAVAWGSSRRAHSQTTPTRQERRLSSETVRASRLRFDSSFSLQKSSRVAGRRNSRQLACACQKQPCTNTTVFHFGRTMSGFPGRPFLCSRNRIPARQSRDRSWRSGFVSRPRIRAISAERFVGSITSTINAFGNEN